MATGWDHASSASLRAVTAVNVEQAPKTQVAGADPPPERGRPPLGNPRTIGVARSRRGKDDGTRQGERQRNTGDPPRWPVWTANRQPARDRVGPGRKSDRPIVPSRRGNARGGKGPDFQTGVAEWTSGRLAMSLTPPEKVGKLRAALRTKAKESPSYRFYALYDKLYRADVLAHAYERCRS